jgi:hypothetical protein
MFDIHLVQKESHETFLNHQKTILLMSVSLTVSIYSVQICSHFP